MLGFIFTVEVVRLVQVAWDRWRLWRIRKIRVEPLTDAQIFDLYRRQDELKKDIEKTQSNSSLSLRERDEAIAQHRKEIEQINERIVSVAYDIPVRLALNYIIARKRDVSFDDISDSAKNTGRFRRAMNDLRQQASDGVVAIYGRNNQYSPSLTEPIDADFWKRNKLELMVDSDGAPSIRTASSSKGAITNDDESYKEMFVSKKRVMELWPPHKQRR
jgi:hypothetical protein